MNTKKHGGQRTRSEWWVRVTPRDLVVGKCIRNFYLESTPAYCNCLVRNPKTRRRMRVSVGVVCVWMDASVHGRRHVRLAMSGSARFSVI